MTPLLKRWKGWNMGMEAVMTPHKQGYKNKQKQAKQLNIISFFLCLLCHAPCVIQLARHFSTRNTKIFIN
jgi:hypothetical protein